MGGGFGLATGIKPPSGAIGDTTVTLANTSYKGAMSIALVGISLATFSGNVYTDEGSSAYNCDSGSGGTNLTVNLRVNGAGSYSDTCDASTGAWSIASVGVSSGQTISVYLSGGSARGSHILLSNGTEQNDVDIFQNRVILRDDVNGSITNSEISSGQDTGTTDDLINVSGLFSGALN